MSQATDQITAPLEPPCVVSYYDDGRRFGIFLKRGRDFAHMITSDGIKGQAVRVRKWIKGREREWKLHTNPDGSPYKPERAARVLLESARLRGATKTAEAVLKRIAEGKPATSIDETMQALNEGGHTMATQAVEIKPDLSQYKAVKAASGRKSYDVGDEAAIMLRGKELKDAYAIVAKKLDVSERSLKEKYGHLNPGQQRMNLGNRLRAFLRAKDVGQAGKKAPKKAPKKARKTKAKK